MKELFRMKLNPTEGGLSVWTETYFSVHETPCYYFCVADWMISSVPALCRGTTAGYEMLKARGVKFKRVSKLNSRFAFETKELAYDNLVYLKKLQLGHLNRDIELLGAFMSFNENKGMTDLSSDHGQLFIPNTNELVNNHFNFD